MIWRNNKFCWIIPVAAIIIPLLLLSSFTQFGSTFRAVNKWTKAYGKVKQMILPTGASDIVVVRGEDGSLAATPIKVHFGELPGRKFEISKVKMMVNERQMLDLWVGKNGILNGQIDGEELVKFGLNEGVNEVEFKVRRNGKIFDQHSRLYFWDYTFKMVVADIDGTITKSDVIGMALEEDWLQPGVLSLFGQVQKAGYKFVYLSARPAAMGSKTRDFILRSGLPPGPVLLSPEPLMSALQTAIRNPDKIKIKNLHNLEFTFNVGCAHPGNPFVAGFGNQKTDLKAYEALNIPLVFLISKKSDVHIFELNAKNWSRKRKHNTAVTGINYDYWDYTSTYSQMARDAATWFPTLI